MAKNVKLADIAGKLGVSVVTVSKALSGQKGVSEEMREKIIKLADELGYVQPSVARQRAQSVSYQLGVLIQEGYLGGYSSFYWQMHQKVAQNAVERGCFSMLEVVTAQMEKQGMLPKLLTENKADGIIIIGPLDERYLGKVLREVQVPVIFMDYMDKKQRLDCVISDSFYGGYYVTNHLISMGHREIAYVGTLGATGSITDRYLGYAKALIEHGLEFRDEWVIDDRDRFGGAIDEEKKLKLPKNMPTAFFCNCDLCAGMLIRKLEKAGFKVPADVSVVGFDDFIYPGLCDIELTSYAVDTEEMAKITVGSLISKIDGSSYRKGIQVVEGRLMIRESVKRI